MPTIPLGKSSMAWKVMAGTTQNKPGHLQFETVVQFLFQHTVIRKTFKVRLKVSTHCTVQSRAVFRETSYGLELCVTHTHTSGHKNRLMKNTAVWTEAPILIGCSLPEAQMVVSCRNGCWQSNLGPLKSSQCWAISSAPSFAFSN